MNRYKNYGYKGTENKFIKAIVVLKNDGLLKVLDKFFQYGIRNYLYPLQFIYYKNKRKYFILDKENYLYFYHPHNHTWANERAVEVAIIHKFINDSVESTKILEVGNVLSNYFKTTWDIIDKFDNSGKALNEDISTFHPLKAEYNLIISISTIEHIGYDDDIKSSLKTLETLLNLKENFLYDNGIIVVTFPLGYNEYLDKLFFEEKLGFDRISCLKRVSKYNDWIQVKKEDMIGVKYNSPFPYGNGIVIGIVKK